jgi:hypothetical protein
MSMIHLSDHVEKGNIYGKANGLYGLFLYGFSIDIGIGIY